MFKRIKYQYLLLAAFILAAPAYAVLPNIFATQPAGNVQASLLDTNFTFLESQGVQGLTTTGSSNAYVATPADAWLTGYSAYVGRALTVKPSFTNTGASTINVSVLGGASIYKNVAGVQTALASGDIVSGTPAILICDGSGFLLANPTPSVAKYIVGTFTYDVSTASGTQNVTGLGLTPLEVDFVTVFTTGGNANAISWGSDDLTNHKSIANSAGAIAPSFDGSHSINAIVSGGNAAAGAISSAASGQFTVTWTKTGSPTGTITVVYTAKGT